MEEWSQIRHLHQQGLSNREIARRTGFSRDTVAKYLGAERPPRYAARRPDPDLLLPFQDYVKGRLVEFPRLSSRRLLREARERGYRGSYSTLLRFVRPLRTGLTGPPGGLVPGSGGRTRARTSREPATGQPRALGAARMAT